MALDAAKRAAAAVDNPTAASNSEEPAATRTAEPTQDQQSPAASRKTECEILLGTLKKQIDDGAGPGNFEKFFPQPASQDACVRVGTDEFVKIVTKAVNSAKQ
jgi:guanyl-specific ribonuclease Sa